MAIVSMLTYINVGYAIVSKSASELMVTLTLKLTRVLFGDIFPSETQRHTLLRKWKREAGDGEQLRSKITTMRDHRPAHIYGI